MERILVAVDFSDASRTALRSAVELSRAFAAPLHVVHVIPSQICGPELAQMVSLLAYGSTEAERRLMDFVLGEFKGTEQDLARIDYRAVEGSEATQILQAAEQWNASLLVVGSHGKTASAGPFLGSVSSRVLSRSTRPVLVVPEATRNAAPERLLAALDGDRINSQILQQASGWSKALGAELTVLHVLPEILETGPGRLAPDAEEHPQWQALMQCIRKRVQAAVDVAFPDGPRPRLQYRVGRPYVEICAEAAEGRQDLILLGYEHEKGILDLGNTAGRVAHSSPCPVLVLRPRLG